MIKVACAIIEQEGKVLTTQRAIDDPHALKWELPGGKLEDGELAEDCIIREIKEELAINVKVLNELPAHKHTYPDKAIELIPFVCEISSGNVRANVHQDFKWIAKEQLLQLDWLEADVPIIQDYLIKLSSVK